MKYRVEFQAENGFPLASQAGEVSESGNVTISLTDLNQELVQPVARILISWEQNQ